MAAYVCDHCGRIAGDEAGGYSSLHDHTGSYRFCHPNVPGRPDCYHLVTACGEPIGTRWTADGPHAGPDRQEVNP